MKKHFPLLEFCEKMFTYLKGKIGFYLQLIFLWFTNEKPSTYIWKYLPTYGLQIICFQVQ